MAANIGFLSSDGVSIHDLAGSGIGFFGSDGFGASVRVGEYQGRNFITNSTGTTQGPEISSVQFLNQGSGIIGQAGSGVGNLAIPNRHATLNIRFTYDTACNVQNAELRIYDRSNINNSASGITCKGIELIHPDPSQVANGSGDSQWATLGGSGSTLTLANSPGMSGLMAGNGSNSTHLSDRHDWFTCLSVSPDSIGSKLFGLYVSLEYL